jgi:hypothetical protein
MSDRDATARHSGRAQAGMTLDHPGTQLRGGATEAFRMDKLQSPWACLGMAWNGPTDARRRSLRSLKP